MLFLWDPWKLWHGNNPKGLCRRDPDTNSHHRAPHVPHWGWDRKQSRIFPPFLPLLVFILLLQMKCWLWRRKVGWKKHKPPCAHVGLLGEVSPVRMLTLPRSQPQD